MTQPPTRALATPSASLAHIAVEGFCTVTSLTLLPASTRTLSWLPIPDSNRPSARTGWESVGGSLPSPYSFSQPDRPHCSLRWSATLLDDENRSPQGRHIRADAVIFSVVIVILAVTTYTDSLCG